MNKLPPEILQSIFSNFSIFQLLKFEEVCKKWKDFLRSNISLWNQKDFLINEKECSPCFETCVDQIESQFVHSNGILDTLYVPIDIDDDVDQDAIKRFSKILPKTNVKNLTIYFAPDLIREPQDECGSEKEFKEWCKLKKEMHRDKKVTKAIDDVLLTIFQCKNLIKLYIRSNFETWDSRFVDIGSQPISNCKLEEFFVEKIDQKSLFSTEERRTALTKILSQARLIRFENDQPIDCDHTLELFKSVKDTIEDFYVELTSGRYNKDLSGFSIEVFRPKSPYYEKQLTTFRPHHYSGANNKLGRFFLSFLQENFGTSNKQIYIDENEQIWDDFRIETVVKYD